MNELFWYFFDGLDKILQATHFHLLNDFYFQNDGIIQDGVFQIFYAFL
jgi:hypothetical protein